MLAGVFKAARLIEPVRFASVGDDFLDDFLEEEGGVYAADLKEPSLDQLLADPMTRLLMERDGVDMPVLMEIIEKARARLSA